MYEASKLSYPTDTQRHTILGICVAYNQAIHFPSQALLHVLPVTTKVL